jgi:putative transposase
MNQVFRYTGYSKQAFHQKMDRELKDHEQQMLLLPIIRELREEHPGVAARELYLILKPEAMGRDKFESFCFDHGLKLKKPKAYKRTTDSRGVIRFPNLVAGVELKGINQAWSSDITYYEIDKEVYYITFIMDLYSRKIVGHSVSKRLLTVQTTIPALKMALKDRMPGKGVIFHSDGGGQYYCKDFLKLTSDAKMKNSMCDVVYENSYAERINRTIKEQYLSGYHPRSFTDLVQKTSRAVFNYNNVKPHKSLKKKTPANFELCMPAGGYSLPTDNFCSFNNPIKQQQKNYQLSKSSKPRTKGVEKTVNVI